MAFKAKFLNYRTNVKEVNNKASFFTTGELLDKYLAKQEKVSVLGDTQFSYISFRRRYNSLSESLALIYRSNQSYKDSTLFSSTSSLARSYLNNLSSVWWANNNHSINIFNYPQMTFSLNIGKDVFVKSITNDLVIDLTKSLFTSPSLFLLDELYILKIKSLIERSIWSFIPHSPKFISGGTSYLALAIGQIPTLTVDYMLTLAQPLDILEDAFKFASTKYFELYLINMIQKNFNSGWISSVLKENIYQSYLVTYFNVDSFSMQPYSVPSNLRLIERLSYLQSVIQKRYSHELEQIEYYETAISPFEVFIKTWVALFDERVRFLDLVYNNKSNKQLLTVWTNYLEYLEMHEAEEVILDHKDIPSYQQGLILIWGFTNFKSLTLNRIRVTNMISRNYLHAYESLKFSKEIGYSYATAFVDEITEESAAGYFDVISFLEEFYDEGFEYMEEEFPYVYHWDDEYDTTLGQIFPYVYIDIFNDQYEFSTYYYQTDEMARDYNSMQLHRPYNMAAHGYEWLVPNNETDMAWFNSLFYSALSQESEMDFVMFKDQYSEETWEIKSFFNRTLKIPTVTTLNSFIEERSLDLSLLAVSQVTNINTLTTYSLDPGYDLYLTPQKNTIVSQRYDSWFPTFIATKFRRV